MSPSPLRPRGALVLAAAVVLTAAVVMPVRAARPTTTTTAAAATVPGPVRQLLHDLRAIAPGAAITDEEKLALATDLTALADSLVKPSAASVEQLADDLAAAAASGKLTRKIETVLARDLAAVLGRDAPDPVALRLLADEVRTFLAAYGLDDADVQQFAADLETIIDDFQTDSVSTRQVVTLRAEGIPFGLLENYGGRAKLVTVQSAGRAAQTVLNIETNDLPPANPYTVAVTRRSDGGTLVLGTLKVRAGFPGVHFEREDRTGTSAVSRPEAEILSFGTVVFGGAAGKPFPGGFDPADIDTLTLTDRNGTERLAGSFVGSDDLQLRTRLVNLRMDAGAADPGAAGRGVLSNQDDGYEGARRVPVLRGRPARQRGGDAPGRRRGGGDVHDDGDRPARHRRRHRARADERDRADAAGQRAARGGGPGHGVVLGADRHGG